MLLGLFSDSLAPSCLRYQIQAHFFDGPNSTGTIRDLYREMSGGAVEVIGELQDWSRSILSLAQVTSGVSRLASRVAPRGQRPAGRHGPVGGGCLGSADRTSVGLFCPSGVVSALLGGGLQDTFQASPTPAGEPQ